MKIRILIIILLITKSLCSQDVDFMDSLFQIDFSQISDVSYDLQMTDMKRLESDWGLSAGVNITNSFQEEIDAGLSTRVFAKINVLSSGYYTNRVDAEIIRNQMMIDSLQGIDRAADHNYGIYYDYIISQYNQQKIEVIDSIITSSKKLKDYYATLYYNKLIDYEKLLKVTSTIDQYYMLQKSQIAYNEIVESMQLDSILPAIPTNGFEVDFKGIQDLLSNDTTASQVVLIRDEILDLKHEKEKSPSLSITGGYDISRRRPYYSVGFSTRITRNKSQHIDAHKEKYRNDLRLENIQRKKELINLQYEYEYKDKQIRGLYLKLEIIKEQKRKFAVKKDILSLEECAEEKKIDLERHMIFYEIMDLRQQQMLLLLRVKKSIWKQKIMPFLKPIDQSPNSRKFSGKRFLVVEEGKVLNRIDIHILEQNEITPLLPKDLIVLKNVMTIDPARYETRAEMESAIEGLIDTENIAHFVIRSMDSFKALELRTIEQKDYHLTASTK